MTTISVALPECVFAALRKAPHELAKEMRIAAAAHWYQQGEISMESAAEIGGLGRAEFLDELARRHVDVFSVDFDDLKNELANG